MENTFTGVVDDPRSLLDQEQNWSHEELFGQGGFSWAEIPENAWPVYPIRNQNGSGKCGPFSGVFALGRNEEIENGKFVLLDTDYPYSLRANTGPGMWMDNLFSILCNQASFPDPNLLSDNNTDVQSAARAKTFTDAQKQDALKYRGKSWVYIPDRNIDSIAQAIAMGYTPIYLMRCNIKEWTAEPFVDPTVTEAEYNVNHFIPNYVATLWKGNESTVVNDSWGSSYGRNGRRILSKDFIAKRVFQVGYVIDLKNEDIGKPNHNFYKILNYGDTGPEVVAWQSVLQYEKFLPTHTMAGAPLPLGSFLSMTAQATRKWQMAHGLMDFATEPDIKKIRVGEKSILEANKIYS